MSLYRNYHGCYALRDAFGYTANDVRWCCCRYYVQSRPGTKEAGDAVGVKHVITRRPSSHAASDPRRTTTYPAYAEEEINAEVHVYGLLHCTALHCMTVWIAASVGVLPRELLVFQLEVRNTRCGRLPND
jgi:hypothetical protein